MRGDGPLCGNVAAPRPLASIYGEAIGLESGKSIWLADGSLPSETFRFIPDDQRVATMLCPNHRYKRVGYEYMTGHRIDYHAFETAYRHLDTYVAFRCLFMLLLYTLVVSSFARQS